MNAEHPAQDLLTAFGQLTGLPNLRFDSQGCARLVFGSSVPIDLEVDSNTNNIWLYGVLGPVPPGGRERLYRALLEGNLFGTQTLGSTLAVDPVQEEVLLCRAVDLATASATGFAELLGSFAGMVQQWQHKLGSGELVAGGCIHDCAAPALQQHMYMRC
jgi:hypothetical protein